MALPPAPFKKSRLITTAIAAPIWWVITYLTGVWVAGGKEVTHVVPVTMATAVFITYMFIPYFATHSVLMGGLKGVLKGKIILPDAGVDAGASGSNAWRAGAINSLIFGAVPAIAGFFLAHGSTTELSARQFAMRFATGGALIAGIVVFIVAGNPLLKATRVPRGKPVGNGDPNAYLWGYFVVPHAFTNFVLNAALAFSLSPVPFAGGTARVPAVNVVIDTAITFIVLAWIIGRGARSQATTETEWGLAPHAAAVPRTMLAAFLTPLLAGLGFAVALGAVFKLTHTETVGIYTWSIYRGVAFGAYSAWLAKSVAQATVYRVLNPKNVPVAAEGQTA